MNIYLFELKSHSKTFLIWTACILFVLLVFMVGIYPVFNDAIDDVMRVINGFPPQFAAAFGFDLEGMFGFGGFYAFGFMYISLFGAIMAASLGLSAFAREKRSKCVDFLLTKPVSRETIFTAKLLGGLTVLAATNAIYIIAATLVGTANGVSGGDMFAAALSLLLTQLVFYAAAIVYATLSKRVRSVSGAATAFGFAGFILSALVNILEEEAVRFIAPLKYFDPTAVFSGGGYEWPYALTGAAVIVICASVAWARFRDSDVHAV